MDGRGENHVRESSGGSGNIGKSIGREKGRTYERERVRKMTEPKKGKRKKERKLERGVWWERKGRGCRR